jgi:hypothetical protein
LNESQSKGKEKVCADEQDEHGPTPYYTIDCVDNALNYSHRKIIPPFLLGIFIRKYKDLVVRFVFLKIP